MSDKTEPKTGILHRLPRKYLPSDQEMQAESLRRRFRQLLDEGREGGLFWMNGPDAVAVALLACFDFLDANQDERITDAARVVDYELFYRIAPVHRHWREAMASIWREKQRADREARKQAEING